MFSLRVTGLNEFTGQFYKILYAEQRDVPSN